MSSNHHKSDLEFGRIIIAPTGEHFVEVKFFGANGKSTSVAVDFSAIRDARKLTDALRDRGYVGPTLSSPDASALDEGLMTYAISSEGQRNTFIVTKRGGWTDDLSSFRIGNVELPSGRDFPALPGLGATPMAQNGTLSGWQNGVAEPALRCPAMMLTIAAAFAAPTLRLVQRGPGGLGLNLLGKSGTGKTTALLAAASVLSYRVACTWDTTAQGLQDKAQEYCDLPLTVDSMESIPDDQRKAMPDTLAHILTSGTVRTRSKAWSAEHAIDASEFRVVVLSTEEAGPIARSRQTGAAVRLIDVPVFPNEGDHFGIVEHFPPGVPAARRRAYSKWLMDQVRRQCELHHGHALPRFVRGLLNNKERARELLASFAEAFRVDPAFAELNGRQARMLDQFALCFAAGALGIYMKILPWRVKHFREAIVGCTLAALNGSADRAEIDEKNAKRIMAWVNDPARSSLELSSDLPWAALANVDLLRAFRGRKAFVMVRAENLQKAFDFPSGQLRAAMKMLRGQGHLVTENRDDSMTSLYKFTDGGRRFYVFRIR